MIILLYFINFQKKNLNKGEILFLNILEKWIITFYGRSTQFLKKLIKWRKKGILILKIIYFINFPPKICCKP